MLREAPTAFGADYESTRSRPDSHFIERAHDDPENFIIGGFADNRLFATTGGMRELEPKRQHIGVVWGMYVHPDYRGQGHAAKLLAAVLQRLQALPGLEQIQLSVTVGNKPAHRLYERAGFVVFGEEPAALKVNGVNYDELHLQLPSTPSG